MNCARTRNRAEPEQPRTLKTVATSCRESLAYTANRESGPNPLL